MEPLVWACGHRSCLVALCGFVLWLAMDGQVLSVL